MMAPMFKHLNSGLSKTTSVASMVLFNCSAFGRPTPKITWYYNGLKINNGYVVHFQESILQISSVDPEDEGTYECLVENDVGEIKMSGQLSVRKKRQIKDFGERPKNIQCLSVDTKSFFLLFESKQKYDKIYYYIASKTPYQWLSPPLVDLYTEQSVKLPTANYMKPFQSYGIFIRGLIGVDDGSVALSPLSHLVECFSQGISVKSTATTNGIFIWWSLIDPISSLIIQFWNNETTINNQRSLFTFSSTVVGTYKIFVDDEENSDVFLTWPEIEPLLNKIPADSKQWISNNSSPKVFLKDNYKGFFNKLRKSNRVIFPSTDGAKITEVGELVVLTERETFVVPFVCIDVS